eukprot:scaffold10353_cov127-Isochrysis_galbana.AAC.11
MSSRPVARRRKRYSGSSSGAGDGAAHEDLGAYAAVAAPVRTRCMAESQESQESTEMDMVPGPEVVRTLPTTEQAADILTKALDKGKFVYFRDIILGHLYVRIRICIYTCHSASLQHFFEANTSAQNHPHPIWPLQLKLPTSHSLQPQACTFPSYLEDAQHLTDRMIPRDRVSPTSWAMGERRGSVCFIVMYPRPPASHNPLVEGCSMVGAAWAWWCTQLWIIATLIIVLHFNAVTCSPVAGQTSLKLHTPPRHWLSLSPRLACSSMFQALSVFRLCGSPCSKSSLHSSSPNSTGPAAVSMRCRHGVGRNACSSCA